MVVVTTRRDGSGIKRERQQRIHKMIIGAGDVNLDKLKAWCSYHLGLNHSTTTKYLDDLVTLGFVEIDEGAGVVRERVPEQVNS